jgi:predicted hydrolase (HD superfamily)
MEKSNLVLTEVSGLYQTAATTMGKWMWRNHTQWVADKAEKLAQKYGADTQTVYCVALLHDLGDSRYERGHEGFDNWSEEKAQEILLKFGFIEDEIREIMEAVRTHSCRPGNLPLTREGKVLATADGMWHLQTSFFPLMSYMHRPDNIQKYEEWQEWFKEKIERDFNTKICFDDEKAEVKADYDALSRVFKNTSF